MLASKRYYFLLTLLPSLPEPGAQPPVDLRAFRERVADEPGLSPLVDGLLLSHDLLLRQAAISGQMPSPGGVVLGDDQAAGTAPLPEFLHLPEHPPRRMPDDAVWDAYFRYADALARRVRSAFLTGWVALEVSLRNALAAARAAVLGVDGMPYLVAPDLAGGQTDFDVGEAISAWQAAPDPLSGLRALDRRRAGWIESHSRYFSFAADEVLAYAARLMIVHRWHALAREPGEASGRSRAPNRAAGGLTGSA